MKTSSAGRALIVQREGSRLTAYRDTKGILTIGVGHTGRMSPPKVTVGMTISEAECDAMLGRDLAPIEAVINTAVKVPLSQNEFDALASLGFNIGAAGLKRSTVLKKLNLGDIEGAARAFADWSKPAALAARRRAETAQFLTPDAAYASQPVGPARAKTLATLAGAAKDRAHAAQSGAATLIIGAATTSVTAHAHHPAVALIAGGLLLAAGLCAAFLAVRGHAAAGALAANAGRQGPAPASPITTAETPADVVTS